MFFRAKFVQNQFFFTRNSKNFAQGCYVFSAFTAFACLVSSKPSTIWSRVEEKFGEQNFRVLSEMRGKNLYMDPTKYKIWIEMGWKCRIPLCQNLEFRFLKNWVSGKWEIGTSKPEIRFRFWILGMQNWKSTSKIQKSAPQNLKFDFDFEFWGQKFDFENPKSISPIPLESCFET